MITLAPLSRRITYVVTFEALAILLATWLLATISGKPAQGNLPVAIMASTAAVLWNFIYNSLFEAWESARAIARRTLSIRILHSAGFELGLVAILIPLFMWWYDVGLLAALAMEAALLIFFLVFTFGFTWVLDLIFVRAPSP